MPRPRHLVGPMPEQISPEQISEPGKGPWLRENLLALILAMTPGDLYPSERVLAERFRVARMTVRRELIALEDNGLLERVPGRGTFVRRPSGMVDTLSAFTDMRAWLHATAKIISVRTVRPTASERETLALAPGSQVILLHRVRLSQNQPMAVERIKLPAERFRGLTREQLVDRSLYQTLARSFGAHALSAEQTISVANASDQDAELLGIAPGAAVMRIDRVTRDNLGLVMDMSTAICHPERYNVHIQIGLT